MKLLKTRVGWRRWMLAHVAGTYASTLDQYEEPKEYPCYAYAVVQSFGYEEEQPRYLYRADLPKLAKALEFALTERKVTWIT